MSVQSAEEVGRRAAQRDSRRDRILATALELFVRRGYTATRVGDLAEAADMSAGLLFHYFPSKRHLYEELVRSSIERSAAAFAAIDDRDPVAGLYGLVRTAIESMRASRTVAYAFVLVARIPVDSVLADDVLRAATRNTLDRTSDLIRSAQALGRIEPGDPLARAVAVWGAIQGVAELLSVDDDLPCPDAGDILRMVSVVPDSEGAS